MMKCHSAFPSLSSFPGLHWSVLLYKAMNYSLETGRGGDDVLSIFCGTCNVVISNENEKSFSFRKSFVLPHKGFNTLLLNDLSFKMHCMIVQMTFLASTKMPMIFLDR
jgi:hypothetical protein